MLRHIPNLLTLLRIALVPLLALRILRHDHSGALAIAFIAAVTDALDGLLARRFGWQSRLGGLLDPLADKALLTAAFLALAMIGEMPLAMMALVLVRDVVIVGGAVAYHFLVGPFDARPTLWSKFTTLLQLLLVLAMLLRLTFGWPAGWWETALLAMAALLTLVSGLHYVAQWGRSALRHFHERRLPTDPP